MQVLEPDVFYPLNWATNEWRSVSHGTRQRGNASWLNATFLISNGMASNTSYTTTFWTHGWGRRLAEAAAGVAAAANAGAAAVGLLA